MAEIDFAQRRLGAFARLLARQAQRHVAPHLLPRQQARILEHHRAGLGRDDGLVARIVQSRQGAQQGGLARARPAQQGDELAGRDLQVQALQHRVGAEGAGEAFQAHGRRLGRGGSGEDGTDHG